MISVRGDGSFLILWNQLLADGVSFGVFGNFFDPSTNSIGTPFEADTVGVFQQTLPSSFILPDNRVILTWTSNGVDILSRVLLCTHDCVLKPFSNYPNCTVPCGGSNQTRTTSVSIPPLFNGSVCPPLTETSACNTKACPSLICSTCFGSSCYKVIAGVGTESDAKSACSSLPQCPSGNNCLASIDSVDERLFLINSVVSSMSWIGHALDTSISGACFTISPYGTITQPQNGCNASYPAICEVIKPSSCV